MAFPEHLTADILSRLPVKSLVRFSSVQKPWHALIRNRRFISQQLNLNAKEDQNSGCLVVKYRSQITRQHVISLLLQGTDGYMFSNLDIPSVMDSYHLKLVGSCNGLLCLAQGYVSHLGSPIVLWNPSLREFRVLPDGRIRPDNLYNVVNVEVYSVAHGFGYHPLIDDYKVVRIVCFSCSGTPCIRAEVYSLKMDCWQEIDTFYFEIYEPSCKGLNGALYWIGYGGSDRELIVFFDMSDEVFGELQLPDVSILEKPMCTKLAVLKEALYLIGYTFSGRQREFCVWKMIEDDAEVFWRMEFTIGPLLGVDRPLGYGSYEEIYMESRKGELVLYNPSTKETKSIPTGGFRSSLEVHFYMESLVSTHGQNDVVQETNRRIM